VFFVPRRTIICEKVVLYLLQQGRSEITFTPFSQVLNSSFWRTVSLTVRKTHLRRCWRRRACMETSPSESTPYS